MKLELSLILPPALLQKVVFCTQMDTKTHAWTDRQADSSIPPAKLLYKTLLIAVLYLYITSGNFHAYKQDNRLRYIPDIRIKRNTLKM